MANPNPSWNKNTGDAADLVPFGNCPAGAITEVPDAARFPMHLWNDKDGGSVASMQTVQIGARDGSGTALDLAITGTEGNEYLPMIEARSSGASGTPDDAQSEWTPIGGTQKLSIGDMPANSRRSIYFRMNVPADAPEVAAGEIVPYVEYTFE